MRPLRNATPKLSPPSQNASFYFRVFIFSLAEILLFFSSYFSSIPEFRIFKQHPEFSRSSGTLPEWHLVFFRCSFGVPP